MPTYRVKLGFWLRAYDSFEIDAETSEDAIDRAKKAAHKAMETTAPPEHIDTDERREGSIIWIDQVGLPLGNATIGEDIAFDDDRIHPETPPGKQIGTET
ncbi:hypothetical protein [Kozakia baliensis]|uniref:Uncharacterized protein n=1 Tax=Kozakia baliensis TaxID=153496 RepID=A0A1D8UY65_9PROT|nr:hypothetical protein [Kozakia baliensis]AOX18497.1 hypothetical protein A0U89_14445 [Kozakia baliensis]GBR32149.1 hypothetical protein AA0488_2470 [Kozakia baliensis NRIC 0488]GEL65764.1 hypothetical protein KBA01_30500 [Kozakia baliensis]